MNRKRQVTYMATTHSLTQPVDTHQHDKINDSTDFDDLYESAFIVVMIKSLLSLSPFSLETLSTSNSCFPATYLVLLSLNKQRSAQVAHMALFYINTFQSGKGTK